MLPRLLFGYKATQCLYVAAKLNIADQLINGEKHIDELANIVNAKPEPLYRVLRCLVSLGVFSQADKTFSLNEAAKRLETHSDNSLKDFIILCGEELYQATGGLLYSVQNDSPAFDHIFGTSHWEYLERHPEKANIFHDAMERGSKPTVKSVIQHYDFKPYKHIIDVGGGKGHFVCEILKQNQDAIGKVLDLPNAQPASEKFIKQQGLSSQCSFVAGDFFKSIPEGGDLYLLQVVLHDWDDERALQILKNCKQAMVATGTLLIVEKVIETDTAANDLAYLGDINMLVMLPGKERTLDEFKELLQEAGFKFKQRIKTDTVFSIIEACP